MFEIKYVEARKPFYQLNNLYVYTLTCEVMDAELDQDINTSIEAVDTAVDSFGFIVTLGMVGLAASTASATVQRATSLSPLTSGFSIGSIDLINDGTGYTAAPAIGISTAPTQGINATAVAIMTSRDGQTGQSIDKILITNPGFGYTEPPTVTIRSVNVLGSGGIATAILADNGLSAVTITDGGDEYGEIPNVSISTAPSGGINATGEVVLDTLGKVVQIRYTNSGAGYLTAPTITIDPPAAAGFATGNYLYKELVRGVGSGTTAFVQEWDFDDRILKVTRPSGSFIVGEAVVGIGTTSNGSDAKYIVKTVSTQDDTDAFNENTPFETEANEILDFSEINPFGEF
tara:strand:- start:89 stop:1123 length:1035 start_codon:yes stop_codon:yes gene_type:complete